MVWTSSAWLSNTGQRQGAGTRDSRSLEEVERLSDRLYHCSIPVVVVTREVGLGFVPAAGPEHNLINVVGFANQILAERAQSVVFMISGIPQRMR